MKKSNFKKFSLVAALAIMLQVVSCAEPATFSWGGMDETREVKVFDQINSKASITAMDSAGNNYITKVEATTKTEGCQIDDKDILSLTDDAKAEYLAEPYVCVVDYKVSFGGKILRAQKEFKFVEGMTEITISGANDTAVVIGEEFDVNAGVTAAGDNGRDLTELLTVTEVNCTITDGKLDTSEIKVCEVKYEVKDYYDIPDAVVTRKVEVIDPDQVVNILKNGSFEGEELTDWGLSTNGSSKFDYVINENGLVMTMDVSGSGAAHEPQLTQGEVPIVTGKRYKVSFKASSTLARTIELRIQEVNSWYGLCTVVAELDEETKVYEAEFLVSYNLTQPVQIGFMLGKLGDTAPQGEHTVTIDDVVIDELFDYFGNPLINNETLNVGQGEKELLPDGRINFWYVADLGWDCGALSSADAEIKDGKLSFDVKESGDNDWSLQWFYYSAAMFFDGDYVVKFKVNVENARSFKMNDQVFELEAGENEVSLDPAFVAAGERYKFSVQFGNFGGGANDLGKIEFYDFRIVRVVEEV